MENVHETAERFGIERPILEQYSYIDHNNITVVTLTPESEQLWGNYLRATNLAKIAFYKTQVL